MKNLFVLFAAILCTFALNAQNKIEWVGGFPGQPNNWNCPKNWSTHKVPDAFSDVSIPDLSSTTQAYPVIDSEVESIGSLMIEGPAYLTLTKDGMLEVEMETEDGVLIFGMVNNEGAMKLNMPFASDNVDLKKNITGDGTVQVYQDDLNWVNADSIK